MEALDGWAEKRLTLEEAAHLLGVCAREAPQEARAGAAAGDAGTQDGSTHEWVADATWDLVTLDDATGEVYSGFFVDEEGTWSSFRGVRETAERRGLFLSFYSDRGSHWNTPEAGGKVDRSNPTQFGGRWASWGSR